VIVTSGLLKAVARRLIIVEAVYIVGFDWESHNHRKSALGLRCSQIKIEKLHD
jgi:hypothetical protein